MPTVIGKVIMVLSMLFYPNSKLVHVTALGAREWGGVSTCLEAVSMPHTRDRGLCPTCNPVTVHMLSQSLTMSNSVLNQGQHLTQGLADISKMATIVLFLLTLWLEVFHGSKGIAVVVFLERKGPGRRKDSCQRWSCSSLERT